MSMDNAEMFSFGAGDVQVAEVTVASGPVAQVAGQAFMDNVNSVSTASMEATNGSLPSMVEAGLSIA